MLQVHNALRQKMQICLHRNRLIALRRLRDTLQHMCTSARYKHAVSNWRMLSLLEPECTKFVMVTAAEPFGMACSSHTSLLIMTKCLLYGLQCLSVWTATWKMLCLFFCNCFTDSCVTSVKQDWRVKQSSVAERDYQIQHKVLLGSWSQWRDDAVETR